MKPTLDLIIVMPVGPIGPNCRIEHVLDNLDSIKVYVKSTYQVIISDDSNGDEVRQKVGALYPDVIVLKTRNPSGLRLALYTALSHVYRYALENFRFKAVLKLDTDALITSFSPEAEAFALFEKDPAVGMAGRIIKGNISYDSFGHSINNSVQRGRLTQIAKLFTRYFVKRPLINLRIRKRLFTAIYAGYEIGELVFGGAYFLSYECLDALYHGGVLPINRLVGSDIAEDLFFTILVYCVGFKPGDLNSGTLPMGLGWGSLPASPEDLVTFRKKVIHSTRRWKDLDEEAIRAFFRKKRLEDSQLYSGAVS